MNEILPNTARTYRILYRSSVKKTAMQARQLLPAALHCHTQLTRCLSYGHLERSANSRDWREAGCFCGGFHARPKRSARKFIGSPCAIATVRIAWNAEGRAGRVAAFAARRGPGQSAHTSCRRRQRRLAVDELEAVLLHELAHIARRDQWAGLLASIEQICFWWCLPVAMLACAGLVIARATLRRACCERARARPQSGRRVGGRV